MLEKRTYTVQELSKIVGTTKTQAINRKLKNHKISYTTEGRGGKLTYTITDIKDRFRVHCVFDLGFSPQTDFKKLRDFLFYLLGDDDFNWRPAEMMEEYLRIVGKGISRKTISKYIQQLVHLNLFAETSYVYYRVYKDNGTQMHEIVTKEEYSQAWKLYWDLRSEEGYDSAADFSCYVQVIRGAPRKHQTLEQNGLFPDEFNLISDLIAESYLSESDD